MSALTPIDVAAATPTPAPTSASRADGWTPARQRLFLEAVAAGHTVIDACALVGLSYQSAYAFRRRSSGAAFALGWQAAQLLARQHLADTLYVRVIEGQCDTITRPDGSTWQRHRFDNRLAATMLARLDRLADAVASEGAHAAARTVADRFDRFLDSLPDQCLRDADGNIPGPQLPQLRTPAPPPEPAPAPDFSESEAPVWWCDIAEDWRTRFPPPPDFDGEEEGAYGEEGYERELDWDEAEIMAAPARLALARRTATESMDRDAFFAECAAEHARALAAAVDPPGCGSPERPDSAHAGPVPGTAEATQRPEERAEKG